MAKNFSTGVYELPGLSKTCALAEYYEARYDNSFWKRFRRTINLARTPGMAMGMMAASVFWPHFDEEGLGG